MPVNIWLRIRPPDDNASDRYDLRRIREQPRIILADHRLCAMTSPLSTGAIFLFLAAFLACGVEMVEALTIVIAVGVTRSWRSTLYGVASAVLVLGSIVALLGPALTVLPINGLRLVVGSLLLVFGLQWLRKAILRAAGYKAQHDEDAIYRQEVADARAAGALDRERLDGYSFTLAFKGVFLEGLEVVFIVLAFGSAHRHGIAIASVAATLALIVVVSVGVLVRAPLNRVPENAMKFTVGALLTTFGTFWSAEGAGVSWPGDEGALLGILALMLACSAALVLALRQVGR
jgi:uncharacterized membrane protein